jgi:hypothetical protein
MYNGIGRLLKKLLKNWCLRSKSDLSHLITANKLSKVYES